MDVTPTIDVTPRSPSERRDAVASQRRRHNPVAFGLLAVILVGLGFVVYKGLNGATTFFYQADEAVAKKPQIGTKRIQMLGVVNDDVASAGDSVTFTVSWNGTTVPVVHHGDPVGMFKQGVQVVLEGRFAGDTFESDRMLIKHSETYIAQNPGRVASGAP